MENNKNTLWDEKLLVNEPIIDVREEKEKLLKKLAETQAEPIEGNKLFCQEFICKKEQDQLKKLSGLKDSEAVVQDLLDSIAEEIEYSNQSIESSKKSIEKNKQLLEALALSMNKDFKWEGDDFYIEINSDVIFGRKQFVKCGSEKEWTYE